MTDKDRKVEFMKESHNLAGKELAAKMEICIQETIESKMSVSLVGTGKFMDSPDLQERYKNKPEQLTAVRANSQSFFDGKRNTKLYEDMEYQSSFKAEETSSHKRSRQLSTEATAKKAKTAPKPNKKREHSQTRAREIRKPKKKSKKKPRDPLLLRRRKSLISGWSFLWLVRQPLQKGSRVWTPLRNSWHRSS